MSPSLVGKMVQGLVIPYYYLAETSIFALGTLSYCSIKKNVILFRKKGASRTTRQIASPYILSTGYSRRFNQKKDQ